MTSLMECVDRCTPEARTEVMIHVGAQEAGDVREAEMVRAAVEVKSSSSVPGDQHLSCDVHVHRGRDHNLVTAMRDTGELHDLLMRLLDTGGNLGNDVRASHSSSNINST